MIEYLTGKLIKASPDHLVIEVNGVGYRVFIPLSSYEKLPEPGRSFTILTYFHVREDHQFLYGFMTEEERKLFQMLLGISKIGPSLALAVLGGIPAASFKRAVAAGDIDFLSTIRGIGRKTAERMILELKDKIDLLPRLREEAARSRLEEGEEKIDDVLGALLSLGYRQLAADKALRRALEKSGPDWSVERLLKEALAHL